MLRKTSLALALTAWGVSVQADQTLQNDAASATVLPEVAVEAAEDNGSGPESVNGYVANQAMTATKTDTPLIETPQSISVVTEAQLVDQGSLTLQEAVRFSAGVTAEAYGLDNRGDWLFIRGTEHTEYRDGLRVQAQTYHIPRPDMYAMERVEVLRGPASVLYGSGTVGGMVNMVSKRPQAKTSREINIQYGTHDHKQVGIDLTGAANEDGTVLYRLVGAASDSGTQVDFTDTENWFIAPSVTFLPSENTSLTLLGNFQRNKTDGATAAFPPHSGTISSNPNGRLPTSLFTGEPGYDHHYLSQQSLGWEFSHAFNERWTFRQNARISKSDLDHSTIYPNIFTGVGGNPFQDANQRLVTRSSYATKQETDVLVIDNQLQSKWNWGETHHTVLVGVDHMGVKQDNRDGSIDDGVTLFDLYDPVYGNVPESELAVAVDQPDQRIRQTGVYLQDQIRVGEHWTFTAGIRNDRVIDKTEGGDEQIDTAFSKRFGVVYLAENGIAPYFSYSESFNPVVGLDAKGQSFKPRRGKQTEVGLRYQPPNTDSMYMVSIYDLEEENRLSGDPDNPNFSVQKGKAKVWGVELDAVASLTSKLDLIANYTYTHARTEDGASESYVAEVHPHVASLWMTYRFSIGDYTGFKVGGGARFIGSNRDETGTLDVPSVTLFDAMLAYEAETWKASINALNITDETYIASCLSRGDCWYGSRARAVASLTFKF